jgi:hypothetical protein
MNQYRRYQKHLGAFIDPLSAHIIYKLVWDEIHG